MSGPRSYVYMCFPCGRATNDEPPRKSTALLLFQPVIHVFFVQFTDDAVFSVCPCMGCAAPILAVYHWSAMSSSSLYVRLSLLNPMAAIEAWNTWTQHMVALVEELQKNKHDLNAILYKYHICSLLPSKTFLNTFSLHSSTN